MIDRAEQPVRPSPLRVYLQMMGATFLISALLALPAVLSNRGNVWSGLLHGTALTVMLMCMTMITVMFGILTLMRRSPRLMRHADLTMLAMMLLLLEMPVAFLGYPVWRDHRIAVDLVAHGVPVKARLIRMFDTECTKAHRCTIETEYRFTPVGTPRPVEGFVRLGNTPHDPEPAYNYATQNGTVPIRYDPADPSRSLLDWGSTITRAASLSTTLGFLGALGGAMFVMWLAIVALGLSSARKRAQETAAVEA